MRQSSVQQRKSRTCRLLTSLVELEHFLQKVDDSAVQILVEPNQIERLRPKSESNHQSKSQSKTSRLEQGGRVLGSHNHLHRCSRNVFSLLLH